MLSERLRELRKKRGVTQKQVATATSLDERNYQRLEAGSKPTYDTLIALADYFDVSLDELVGRGVSESNEDLRGFFDSTISESLVEKTKVIVSQFEPNRLSLFIVAVDEDGKRTCGGHWDICDMQNKYNAMSICRYFKIVKFLKQEYNLDVTFEWDWFLSK